MKIKLLSILLVAACLSAQAVERQIVNVQVSTLPIAGETLRVNNVTLTWAAAAASGAVEIGALPANCCTNLYTYLATNNLTGTTVAYVNSTTLSFTGVTGKKVEVTPTAKTPWAGLAHPATTNVTIKILTQPYEQATLVCDTTTLTWSTNAGSGIVVRATTAESCATNLHTYITANPISGLTLAWVDSTTIKLTKATVFTTTVSYVASWATVTYTDQTEVVVTAMPTTTIAGAITVGNQSTNSIQVIGNWSTNSVQAIGNWSTNSIQAIGDWSTNTIGVIGDWSTNSIIVTLSPTNSVIVTLDPTNTVKVSEVTSPVGITNYVGSTASFLSTNLVVADAAAPGVLGVSGTTFKTITFTGYKSPRTANVGTVYIQFQADNDTNGIALPSGSIVTWTAPLGQQANLSQFWIDVANANDGVVATWSN